MKHFQCLTILHAGATPIDKKNLDKRKFKLGGIFLYEDDIQILVKFIFTPNKSAIFKLSSTYEPETTEEKQALNKILLFFLENLIFIF